MPKDRDVRDLLGNAVRRARLRLGLSQEQLADLAGLDRTYIGGVERGERNPSLVSLQRIAAALQVTMSELFAGMESRSKAKD